MDGSTTEVIVALTLQGGGGIVTNEAVSVAIPANMVDSPTITVVATGLRPTVVVPV